MSLDLTSTPLGRLLDDELAFSPSYQGVFSNHLAMALVALDQLGAPASVLEATFEAHASDESEPRDDTQLLGERRGEVDSIGVTASIRQRVPALLAGPNTALFHPLIRLGYALDCGHQGQVAAALLDWERRLEVLPLLEPSVGDRRLGDVASALSSLPKGTWRTTFDLDGVARRPDLSAQAAMLDVAAVDALDQVSDFALRAHVTADAFVTLHLVTGARALRAVTTELEPAVAASLVASTMPAMLVAFAAVGAPVLLDDTELDRLREGPLPTVELIVRRAVASPDPHVIKLANTALVEEERTSDPLYRLIAARVVGAV